MHYHDSLDSQGSGSLFSSRAATSWRSSPERILIGIRAWVREQHIFALKRAAAVVDIGNKLGGTASVRISRAAFFKVKVTAV